MFRTLPQNASTALRTDHGVIRKFQHGDSVPDADSQSTATAALPDHHTYDWRLESAHFKHVLRNNLRLASFFCANTGVCTGSINETNDRQFVLRRETHFGHGFPITFGVSTTKKTFASFLVGSPFLVAHHENFLVSEFGESTSHRPVISEMFVAV